MSKEQIDETNELINEALARLIEEGRVEVFINEDGERIFRLKERS